LEAIEPRSESDSTEGLDPNVLLLNSRLTELEGQVAQRLEDKAPIYIRSTPKPLTRYEITYKAVSGACYFVGVAALGVGVYVSFHFATQMKLDSSRPEAALLSFRVFVTISLLIAISKYLFNLGKVL